MYSLGNILWTCFHIRNISCIFGFKQLIKTRNTYAACELEWIFIYQVNTHRNCFG